PHVFEITGKTVLPSMAKVASFLGLGDFSPNSGKSLKAVTNYMYQIQKDLDLPTSLKELNVDKSSLSLLTKQASKVTRLLSNTPYNLTTDKIQTIYENAYQGIK